MRRKSVCTSVLLAVTMLLSMFLFNSTVQAAGFEMEIGSVEGCKGETVIVPVSFKNVPAAGINNCDFTIKYDASIMKVLEDGIIPGPIARNASITFDKIVDPNSGIIKFLYCDETGLGNEAIKSDGVFVNIKFLIKQTAPIGFNRIRTVGVCTFGSTYLEAVPAGITEGNLNVIEKQGYKVSGYITPDLAMGDSSSALKSDFSVGVAGTGINTVTDENGFFQLYIENGITNCTLAITKDGFLSRNINGISLTSPNGFTEVSSVAAPIKMWIGDINNDGAINMKDIIEISKVFNFSKSDSGYSGKCDINKDGRINMADIVAIAKHFNRVPADYSI
ncbi:MAG TPA: cohesin domain-containing protein [Pseudobacteroides sp.]|uniref:cohesin domain-containing protein n=1 Tax=Pseudobacteroides sp. TaxID=1968840 RepID=UPI002F9261C7